MASSSALQSFEILGDIVVRCSRRSPRL